MKIFKKSKIFVVCYFCSSLFVFAQSKVDFGVIAQNSKSLKYVALGSSLSAGVRDGGLYEEAQKTSFPALLAQQMGVKNFKQALLEGNGTGKKIASLDRNGILEYSETRGLDDNSKHAQLPKVIGELDNLGIPYQKVFDIFEGNENYANDAYDNRSYRHLSRLSSDKKSIPDILESKKEKADFFTFEFGLHDFIQFAFNGGYTRDISYMCEREFTGEKVL